MKTSGSSRRAFSHPTIWLLATFCLAIGALVYTLYSTGTAAAAQRQSNGRTAHGRQLSMIDRVAYQRAIEEVYWRHQVWPETNKNPKPTFDQAMSPAQLEKKVTDYLRNSQALEDYWHRPITAEQLQAEMDRMARQSKKSEMLRELFTALGNDPFVIAECLARPILAERLATHFYAFDERFHGDLKRRAEPDLQSHPSVTQGQANQWCLSGDRVGQRRRRSKWTRSQCGDRNESRKSGVGRQKSNSWKRLLEPAQSGTFGPLQEDERRFYAIGLIEKTSDHVKFGTIEWLKEPFESWIAKAESQTPGALLAPVSDYRLPALSETMSSTTDDTWTSMMTTVTDRDGHTAIWTGSEMIVWGGYDGSVTNTGARYDPVTDTWTPTSTMNTPAARGGHTAVWTGSEMIVWGGGSSAGGRYNPLTDSWTPTATTGAPSASGQTAVWTGSEMIVWDGNANTGGRYNPVADTWTPTSTINAPAPRSYYTATWTGNEMIVWGGFVGATSIRRCGSRAPTKISPRSACRRPRRWRTGIIRPPRIICFPSRATATNGAACRPYAGSTPIFASSRSSRRRYFSVVARAMTLVARGSSGSHTAPARTVPRRRAGIRARTSNPRGAAASSAQPARRWGLRPSRARARSCGARHSR